MKEINTRSFVSIIIPVFNEGSNIFPVISTLIFTIKNESILLEKSIFLGGNKILDSVCITISGDLVSKNKIIRWGIKKNI